MKKTSIFRRGMSLLLSLVMILGYIPTVASDVNAASNLDGGLEGQAADVFTNVQFHNPCSFHFGILFPDCY